MKEKERGAALLYVIGLMATVSFMAAGVWQSMHIQTREVHVGQRDAVVRQLAEAGISHAQAAHAQGVALPVGVEHALGVGYYTLATEPREGGGLQVVATGFLRDGAVIAAEHRCKEVLP
jgi:hypothetical protein